VQHRFLQDELSIVGVVGFRSFEVNQSFVLCFIVDWCASGPCLNNGTCTNNQQLGTFQCKCVNGWVGVECSYRKFIINSKYIYIFRKQTFYLASTTITIVLPLGNNTYNNLTYINIGSLFPNTTNSSLIITTIQ
jgi:hypothetical protein